MAVAYTNTPPIKKQTVTPEKEVKKSTASTKKGEKTKK